MTRLLLLLFLVGLLPFFVSAHGYVGSVTIDGQVYTGNEPGGTTNPSVIRQVSTISPVKGAANPSINCGMNATLAANVANANPGSQILVHWVGGATGDSSWPHNTGPIMHYLAQCTGTCSSYDSTKAEWFKISELGVQPDNTSWYQANIAQGRPANVTIPSELSPGGYLLRSELISLQNAMTAGGAEFYPACIQLSIGGSGTATVPSDDECQMPGCYSDSDPGIFDPTVYDPPYTYTFPGPPVPTFVGSAAVQGGYQPGSSSSGGSSGGSSASGSSPTQTAASSSPTTTASSTPANSASPSSPPATTAPTTAPSTTPSATSTTKSANTEAACYVTPSNQQTVAKRGQTKLRKHKRRLIRRGS